MPTVTPAMSPIVTLYGRPDCSLCDEARATLDGLRRERLGNGLPGFDVVERDIGTDPELEARFRSVIPVVEVGGRRLELAVSIGRLRRLLAEGLGDPTSPLAPR